MPLNSLANYLNVLQTSIILPVLPEILSTASGQVMLRNCFSCLLGGMPSCHQARSFMQSAPCNYIVMQSFGSHQPKQPESWNMTVLQPRTKESSIASTNHPTSMLRLLGGYCMVIGEFPNIRDLDIGPKEVGLLLQGGPPKGPPIMETSMVLYQSTL